MLVPRFASCFLIAAALSSLQVEAKDKKDAEFVVRWDPAASGPRSDAEAFEAMRAKSPQAPEVFKIQYFDLAAPPVGAPKGYSIIARSRTVGSKMQLTIKYRGAAPFPPQLLAGMTCPLAGADKPETEVDVSFVSATGQEKRAYSWSCTLKGSSELSFPPELQAKALCSHSTMTRTRATVGTTEVKFERWQFPNRPGSLLEVSLKASDSPAEIAGFSSTVVTPLTLRGAVPIERSKSEAGVDCK